MRTQVRRFWRVTGLTGRRRRSAPAGGRRLRRRLAAAACAACALYARPAEAAPLTLQEAVASALHANPQAQIAALQAGEADDALTAARSVYLPRLWVSSNAGYSNREDSTFQAVDLQGHARTFGLASLGATEGFVNVGVDQVVFDLKRWIEVHRAARAADVARLAEAVRHEALADQVVRQYADVLRLQRQLDVDLDHVRRAGRLQADAAALAKTGRALADDVTLVGLGADAARADVQARRADLATARAALLQSINAPGDGTTVELAEASLPDTDARRAPAADVSRAPTVRLLALRQEMAEQQLQAARAGRFPTVALEGEYSNYGPKRFDNFQNELRVTLDARFTVFDGLQTRSGIVQAEKGVQVAHLQHDAALAQTQQQAQALGRRLGVAQRADALAARRAVNAADQLRLAELRLRTGSGALTDVEDAMEGWVGAAHAAVDVHFQRFILWAALQRTDGRLVNALLGGNAALPAGRTR